MVLYLLVGGMDAQQAGDMLTRIMELSQAATRAAPTASTISPSSSRVAKVDQGLVMEPRSFVLQMYSMWTTL